MPCFEAVVCLDDKYPASAALMHSVLKCSLLEATEVSQLGLLICDRGKKWEGCTGGIESVHKAVRHQHCALLLCDRRYKGCKTLSRAWKSVSAQQILLNSPVWDTPSDFKRMLTDVLTFGSDWCGSVAAFCWKDHAACLFCPFVRRPAFQAAAGFTSFHYSKKWKRTCRDFLERGDQSRFSQMSPSGPIRSIISQSSCRSVTVKSAVRSCSPGSSDPLSCLKFDVLPWWSTVLWLCCSVVSKNLFMPLHQWQL